MGPSAMVGGRRTKALDRSCGVAQFAAGIETHPPSFVVFKLSGAAFGLPPGRWHPLPAT